MNPTFNAQGQMINTQQQQPQANNFIWDAARNCFIDRNTGAMYDANGNPVMMNNQTADGYHPAQNDPQFVFNSNTGQWINKYTGQPYTGQTTQQSQQCVPMQQPVTGYPNTSHMLRSTNVIAGTNAMAETYRSRNKQKTEIVEPTVICDSQPEQQKVKAIPLPGNEYPPFLPKGLYSEKVVKGGYYEYKIKGEFMELDINMDRDYEEVNTDSTIDTVIDLHTSKVVAGLIEASMLDSKQIVETNTDLLRYIVLDSVEEKDEVISILRDSLNGEEVMKKLISLNTMTKSLEVFDEVLTEITNNLFEYVFYLDVVSTSFIDDYYDIKALILNSDDYDTRTNGKLILEYIVNDLIGNMVKSSYQIKDSSILVVSIPTKVVYIDYEDISESIDRIYDEVNKEGDHTRVYGLTKRIKDLYNNLSRLDIKYSGTILVTKKSTVAFYRNVNDTLLLAF